MEPEDEPEMRRDSLRDDDSYLKSEEKPLLKNHSFINVEVSIPRFEELKEPAQKPSSLAKPEEIKLISPPEPPPSHFSQMPQVPEIPPWILESSSIPKIAANNENISNSPPGKLKKKELEDEAPPWVVSQSPNRKSPAKRDSYSKGKEGKMNNLSQISNSPNSKKNSISVSSKSKNLNPTIDNIPELPAWVPKPSSEDTFPDLKMEKFNSEFSNPKEVKDTTVKSGFNEDGKVADVSSNLIKNENFNEGVSIGKSKFNQPGNKIAGKQELPPWMAEGQDEDSFNKFEVEGKGKGKRQDFGEDLPPWIAGSSNSAAVGKNLRSKKKKQDQDLPPWISNKVEKSDLKPKKSPAHTTKPEPVSKFPQKSPLPQSKAEDLPPWFSEEKAPEPQPKATSPKSILKIPEKHPKDLEPKPVAQDLPPWFNTEESSNKPVQNEKEETKNNILVSEPVKKSKFADNNTKNDEKHVKISDNNKFDKEKSNQLPPWFSNNAEDEKDEKLENKAKVMEPIIKPQVAASINKPQESHDVPPWFAADSNETKEDTKDGVKAGIKGPEKFPQKNVNIDKLEKQGKAIEPKSAAQPVSELPPWMQEEDEDAEISIPSKPVQNPKPIQPAAPLIKPKNEAPPPPVPQSLPKSVHPEKPQLPPWMQAPDTSVPTNPKVLKNIPSNPELPPWMIPDDSDNIKKSNSSKHLPSNPDISLTPAQVKKSPNPSNFPEPLSISKPKAAIPDADPPGQSLPPWISENRAPSPKPPNLRDKKPAPKVSVPNENIPVWFNENGKQDPAPFLDAEQDMKGNDQLPPWIRSPNNEKNKNLFFPAKPAGQPASPKSEVNLLNKNNQGPPAGAVVGTGQVGKTGKVEVPPSAPGKRPGTSKLETNEKIFIMAKKRTRAFNEKRGSIIMQKEGNKQGFIQYGDILCLSSKGSFTQDDKNVDYRGVITGDGISYNDLGCISKNIVKEQSFNIQFRQCLFRVEPARQYGFLNVYNKYKNKQESVAEYSQILKKQADEEEQGNEAEVELTTGQILTYGERIQLKHIHSNCFITIKREIANEHGSLKVRLDYKGSENSWLEILPSNKIRQEGEPVRYIDGFLITSKVDKSAYYIHMGTSTIKSEERIGEVNASEEMSVWKAKKYITVREQLLNPGSISTGDSFRILHKDSERYLSAASISVSTLLPEIEKEKEVEDDELTSCVVTAPKKPAEKEHDTKYTDFILDKNKTSRGLWELERINPFQGGPSHLDEEYRLKNIATSMYLHIERTTKLSRTSTDIQLMNSFKFEQKESRSLLLFNTNLTIRHPSKAIFLGIVEKENTIEKYFKGTKIEKHSEFNMQTFESEKKAEIQTTFIFEDESEKNSSHVYQISTILMSLIDIYKQINVWGFLRQNGVYYSSYKMAVDTEIELDGIVNKGKELLRNLKKKILNQNNSFIRENQMTIKDSGLLELLLKLLQLIDIRLTISSSKLTRNNTVEKEKFNVSKLFQSKTKEIIVCPQAVSRKHLRKLASSIYKTMLLCIKDNVSCCEFVKSHNEFLGLQLVHYKTEVSKLLREIFKHSTSTFTESSLNEFQMWVSQLRSLNESMENVKDQVLILKIISSLCMFKDQGMRKYQIYVNKFIFKKLSMFVHLREKANDLEFKFLPINESEEEFIRNNPSISSFCDNGESVLPYISVTKLSDGLTKYLCAIVNLLATASLSKNDSVIKRLLDYNSISPLGLLISIKDNLQVKVKTRFLYLLRVLFLNENPKISPKEFKIIEWDSGTNKIIKTRVFPPEWVIELVEWIRMIWTSQDPKFGDFSKIQQGISFVIELVNITKVLIHNSFTTYEFIEDICPYLALILSDNSNTDIVRLCRSGHWCCCIREKASTHPELLQTLVFKVMRLFDDISQVKLQRQIEFLIEQNQNFVGKERLERFSINFKVQDNQFFNMYLLNVMLSHFEKYIRDYASEQLVQIFNQRTFIKSETEELILLYEPGMVMVKEKCYSCVTSLKQEIENLNLQASYLKEERNIDDNKKLLNVFIQIQRNLNDLQMMMNMKGDSDMLKLGQSLSRCLMLDDILIKFLEQPYPWVQQVSAYRKKVKKKQLPLYRAIIGTLSAYTFHNSKNQELVYNSIALIISYFGNKMGVSRLISHISSSQRTTSRVDHVIIYIFHLITQEKETPHHPYLKILKNLVIDENHQMYLWTQTNIIKFILKNESILSYYYKSGSWNIIEYQKSPGLEFHKTFISLLSLCAVQNEFVTLQCRNIVSFPVLEREICNNETPYSLKITYLMFSLNVYFAHVSDELEAEFSFYYLSEILKNVVYKDLQLFTYYLADFISIVQKLKFPGINKRKDLVLRHSISEEADVTEQELTPDELEALNYWKYILDTKLWKNEQSSGLLIFIKDLSIELKLSRFEPVDEFKMTILKISEIIQRMQAKIEGLSAQNPRMNFDSYIEGISLCWCEIPKYSFENEEDNIEELVKAQCYSNLLDTIKDYLTEQKMSIQDFFMYKLKLNTEIIPSKSLAYKLKTELRTLEFATITTGLSKISAKSNQVMINVKDLKTALIANIGNEEQKYDRKPTMAENLHEILSKQISVYNDREEELLIFIKSIQHAIIEKLLLNYEFPKVLDFCKALFSALYRKKYRKYLFEIFTQFLKVEIDADRDRNQKIRRIELMNKALRQAGIGEIALYMICEGNDLESVIAAIEFLQTMFHYKNRKFSLHILSFFSDPLICFSFFSFFKNCIKDFQDEALNKSQGVIVKRFKSFIDNRKAHEVEMKVKLCFNGLKLIELMCEQNPEEFQDLFRNQTTVNEYVVNVNIVSELTSLLISFSTFENNSCLKQTENSQFSHIRSVCIQCLKTLTALCEGPCQKNQYEVGLNSKVYSFVNWFISGYESSINSKAQEYIDILKSCIEFLSSLIEAELEPFIMKEILDEVDIAKLVNICYFIHREFVSGKETEVYRGDRKYNMWWLKFFESKVPSLDKFIAKIIGVGFAIFNLCLVLKEAFPESDKLNDIRYSQKPAKPDSRGKVFITFEKVEKEGAINFYLENISKIEVNYKGSILQIYFQRPFLTRFLSEKSRTYLLRNIGSFTYQARIEEFFKRCIKYKSEMIYQQRLERYPLIAKFCSKWFVYKTIAFYLTCIINIILLATLIRENGSIAISASYEISRVLNTLFALQITFAFLSLLAYLFEYSPILYLAPRYKTIKNAENRINGTILVTELKKIGIESREKTVWQGFLQIFSDQDVFYSVIYFFISFLAIHNYLWYGVLILDCIKRSQVLKNVLRSITLNYKQLLLTLILGIIITFIFSIIGFLNYQKDYDREGGMYSATLSECFFSTLNHGVRAQGGIGDVLKTSDPWYSRMLFDMAFFIIIIVVLLKVIFGIIIDTFAELRDMREQQIKNLEETCFVCGKSKFEFELRRLSWTKHVSEEHNAHAYAAFFIYIMLKKEDLSGVEKYLKNQVDSKQITFFPKTSISLARFETLKQENKENYGEKFKGIRKRLVKLADYNV